MKLVFCWKLDSSSSGSDSIISSIEDNQAQFDRVLFFVDILEVHWKAFRRVPVCHGRSRYVSDYSVNCN